MNSNISTIIYSVLFCISYLNPQSWSAKADQPVNCLRQQVHDQVWNFHVTQDSGTVNLFEVKEVCSHQLPNRVQILEKGHNFKFAKEDIWQIEIKEDFTAVANFCKDGNTKSCDGQRQAGRWQTYYDQALLVELDNQLRFVANFMYTLKSNVTSDPLHYDLKKLQKLIPNIEDEAKAQFDSVCDRTMVGFVQNRNHTGSMEEHPITCFFAEKDKSLLYESQIAPLNKTSSLNQKSSSVDIQQWAADFNFVQIENNVQAESLNSQSTQQQKRIHEEQRPRASKKSNMFSKHEPSDQMDEYIQLVNNNPHVFKWEANKCMLQKHHPKYDASLCEKGTHKQQEENVISLAQTSSDKVGRKVEKGDSLGPGEKGKDRSRKHKKGPESGQKKWADGSEDWNKAVTEAQLWRNKYKNPEEIPDSMVPNTHDPRNINGYDFTGEIRDQKECGSCYTLGFIQVAEARLKLKYADKSSEIPPISPQFLMECNYMNEGCDGGWAIFHGFMAENGHLVSEKCAPYKARTKNDKCSNYSHCPKVAKVNQSYYVGGYNYLPSEKLIQKEMLMNGPVVTEFKCDDDFQIYKKGVMAQFDKAKNLDLLKQKQNPMALSQSGFNQETTVIPPFDDYLQLGQQQTPASDTQSVAQVANEMKAQMAYQNLDHTIFIVGWGEDEKQGPYWIVRNSYGDSWGMHGDFHVRRGQNDFGIESELSGYDLELF